MKQPNTKKQWKHLNAIIRELSAAGVPRSSRQLDDQTNAVVPLYTYRGESAPPSLVGSAVLVRVGARHFLFTAAHVMEEFNHKGILTEAGGKFVELSGESYRTKLPSSGSHQNDRLDAAVLDIQGELPDDLRLVALPHTELDAEAPAAAGLYCAHGFPYKQSKRRGSELISTPLTYVDTMMPEETYSTLGYSKDSHYLIASGPKWVTPRGVESPRSLPGMSGGGLWRLARSASVELRGQLTAILTDHIKRHHVLVAVTVRAHFGLIERYNKGLLEES